MTFFQRRQAPTLFKLINRQLWSRESVIFSTSVSLLLIGIYTALAYENFLHLQAQNISHLSVFNEIIKPLSGLVLILSLILGVITAALFVPYFRARGHSHLISQASLSNYHLSALLFKSVLQVMAIPIIYFLAISLFINAFSDLDMTIILVSIFVLLMGIFFYCTLILIVSLSTQTVIASLLISFLLIVTMLSFDQFFVWTDELSFMTIFNQLFLQSREGIISVKESVNFLVWVSISLILFSIALKKSRGLIKQKMLISITMLLLATIVCLKAISFILPAKYYNISPMANGQLDKYYQKQLSDTKKPIQISAVVDDSQSRDELLIAVEQLKQFNPNISIKFTNRQAFSYEKMPLAGQVEQFVQIKIENKQQAIRYPFSDVAPVAIAKTIDRIQHKNDQWIVFIEGHNEASVNKNEERSISQFFNSLKTMGWPVIQQNLNQTKLISDNTKLIVIADSKSEWLKSEVDLLLNYLKNGGQLLLLRESSDNLPQALIDYIGIDKVKGTLIDQKGFASGTPHPAIVIINQFNHHPVTDNIQSLVAFPWSVGLKALNNIKSIESSWEQQAILVTHNQVWNEMKIENNQFEFNPEQKEIKTNYLLGIALQRNFVGKNGSDKKQKIVIVGDTSFLSDTAINNYANQRLAINMVSWLLSSEHQTIEAEYSDHYLDVNSFSHFMLIWFFSAIFPVFFFIFVRLINKKQAYAFKPEK